MSIEETENHIDGDQRAMCKETFSNAERECDIRVICKRLSSGIVQDKGPLGLISNVMKKFDTNARSTRLRDAIDSCECEFAWTKSRHDWAVLVHGGQCEWYGEMYGAPFRYASPTGGRHRAKDTGMELAVRHLLFVCLFSPLFDTSLVYFFFVGPEDASSSHGKVSVGSFENYCIFMFRDNSASQHASGSVCHSQ